MTELESQMMGILKDLGPWASAAQDDPKCCQELKDIFLRVIDIASPANPSEERPKMEKFSEEFQDWLLIEAIEHINSVRTILENIADQFETDEDGYLVLKDDADLEEAVTHNINPCAESADLDCFAMKFHRDQYDRLEKKYGPLDLGSYMNLKARIYDVVEKSKEVDKK